jgi:hypothetical protein
MSSLKIFRSTVEFFVVLACIFMIVMGQSGYPPPNIRQTYKQVKPVQPELCYSFCETCQ